MSLNEIKYGIRNSKLVLNKVYFHQPRSVSSQAETVINSFIHKIKK